MKPVAVTKRTIDRRVAALLDMDVMQVSLVTTTFLRLAARDLLLLGSVLLDGLGTLMVVRHQQKNHNVSPYRTEIRFRRSYHMHMLIKELRPIMEKYGVDEEVKNQEELEKAASQGCPQCGAKVERHGRTMVCPQCGTAPFEKK